MRRIRFRREPTVFRFSRRQFIASGLTLGGLAATSGAWAASAGPELVIGTRVIEVKGKAATIFGLVSRDTATHGLTMNAGARLRLRLNNESGEAALIHWHGLTPPNA